MSATVALDSGAVIAIANKDARAIELLAVLLTRKKRIVIPTPVLAEVLRGNVRDVKVHRVLKTAKLIDLTASSARDAGRRLGVSRSSATVDALIVAVAHEHGAEAIVSFDPKDMIGLAVGDMAVLG